MNEKMCERPMETITNKLIEIKEIMEENNRFTDGINYKLYNPEPCNAVCGGNSSAENVENLLGEIRRMAIETRSTLNSINGRL